MKGSLIERGNSYRLQIVLGKDEGGKYRRYFETVKGNKKDAQRRLRQLLTELDKGTFVEPGKLTVAEYLTLWLRDYCKPNLSHRTHELYSYISAKHIIPALGNHIIPALGNVALSELKPQHLQRLYAEKLSSGLSNRTVQLIHITFHKALKNAVKTGLLARNVAEAVDTPRIQHREMHVMSETDLHIFLEYAKVTPYYPLFYTSLFTGMRRAEILALRWCDTDLLLCQLSVTRSMEYRHGVATEDRIGFKEPKTAKSRRLIALSPSTVQVLREHRVQQEALRQQLGLPPITDSDLVFSHWDGKPLLPDSITHAWMKIVRRCGLKGIRLHDARHTHASLLLKQGVHPKIVQERLGHGSIQITLDTYSHVAPGLQQAAANRFDDIVMAKDKSLTS